MTIKKRLSLDSKIVREMNKEELLSLAKDPKFIPGIYNYCDRWCERCPFTSRCLNCELAEEQFGDLESVDISNEQFWKKLSGVMQLTMDMVKETAEEMGIDLVAIEVDESPQKDPPLPDLIGIDRSIAAWKILLPHLGPDDAQAIHLIQMLENLKIRVENRFPCARVFVRPGFDDIGK